MRGFIIALQFLTRLPTPRVRTDDASFAASMRWFPAVGLVIGAIVAVAAWLGCWIDPWVGAIVALAVWVGVTGALHLDGIADLADATGAAHKDREKFLAVLADPHIGSFGVVAIVMQIVAKLVLLHTLLDTRSFLPLVFIPFAARIGPLVWTLWLPPLHQGLAMRFRAGIAPIDVGAWAMVLAGAVVVSPALIVGPLLIILWGWHIRRTVGGISGDGHGAGIEIVETGLLATFVVWFRIFHGT